METGEKFVNDLDLVEAALEGSVGAAAEIGEMLREPKLRAMLVNRGATPDEADEIVSELAHGCFGGEGRAGSLRNLLEKYSGKAPLPAYLGRIALNRLISQKRRKKPVTVSLETGGKDGGEFQVEAARDGGVEDEVVTLLREAVVGALSRMDQEKLVMLRLVQSYRLPQKQVAKMWGWSEFKISRNLKALIESLREQILASLHRSDPWLVIEWEDFLALCGESVDFFDYFE